MKLMLDAAGRKTVRLTCRSDPDHLLMDEGSVWTATEVGWGDPVAVGVGSTQREAVQARQIPGSVSLQD